MQTFPVPAVMPSAPVANRARQRTALIVSTDHSFRQRLSATLVGLRWQVREAGGGAQAWAESESELPEFLIVDSWLPDLDIDEFVKDFHGSFPSVNIATIEGSCVDETLRSPYQQELLYALRRCQETDTVAWNTAPVLEKAQIGQGRSAHETQLVSQASIHLASQLSEQVTGAERLPELIGNAASMLEVSRRIRLVAPRSTSVLIEGPTGTGKELVAAALHRLSPRSRRPFVAINCAAIPEALLEAELFGHTRGAFTGAVQGRTGRIESADGGTLFLDEIGEMPLALQAKLLRFIECGELQRIGDNETIRVDVRILAATHCPLAQHSQTGSFRTDLYYRLAVFLIRTPSLAERMQDIPILTEHFLEQMGRREPRKQLSPQAIARLMLHEWPGNVRELKHILERAAILAGDAPAITEHEIDFGTIVN